MAENGKPRSEEELRSARNAARRARQQQERKLRRSRRNWRTFLVIYSLLFLAAGAFGCWVLFRWSMLPT